MSNSKHVIKWFILIVKVTVKKSAKPHVTLRQHAFSWLNTKTETFKACPGFYFPYNLQQYLQIKPEFL